VIERLTDGPVGELPFMGCGQFDIGLHPGEGCTHFGLGRARLRDQLQRRWSISRLRRTCWRPVRISAFASTASTRSSLRLEKSFGIWSREFTQGYTAGQTGMDRWIDWEKPDFTGRDAALKPSAMQADRARCS
jgi:dimethylglycine dehydrogenase